MAGKKGAGKKGAGKKDEELEVKEDAGTNEGPEARRTPIAKARKTVVVAKMENLYPWATNRGKAERAHKYVSDMGITEENPAGDPALRSLAKGSEEFDQAVMDHYVAHGGLVRGQEKATVVGRKHLGNWKEGASTTEILGHEIDEEGSSAEDDE